MDEIKKENLVQKETGDISTETQAPVSNGSKHKSVIRYYINLVIIFSVLAITFWIGFEQGQKKGTTKSEFGEVINLTTKDKNQLDMSLYWEVFNKLKDKYVDSSKLTPEDLLYNSIKGMLATTEDPYTIFMNPEENKEFNEDIDGTFEGIGAELGIKQGILTVIAPLKDSPSEKAGLRSGDKILKVNDELTENMSIDMAVSKIRGSGGTEVKLTIYRENSEEKTKEIVVTRGVIKVESITFEMKENNIAYFNVVRFGDDTAILLNQLIKQVPKDARGIIIDVRNNPGGYLNVAIDMASFMLPEGKVVVIEEGQDGERKEYHSRGVDKLSGFKTVVLINEGSASASEILAGALKDNRENVTLLGKKSYGKGSVQELVDLPGKTSVKITVAKWLTPKGEQINKKGISPDVEVELTEEDYNNSKDPQLNKALEILSGK
ncbi:MAG: S41 family peptidase [Candidatus Moraniibacteriota bacterium]